MIWNFANAALLQNCVLVPIISALRLDGIHGPSLHWRIGNAYSVHPVKLKMSFMLSLIVPNMQKSACISSKILFRNVRHLLHWMTIQNSILCLIAVVNSQNRCQTCYIIFYQNKITREGLHDKECVIYVMFVFTCRCVTFSNL